MDITRKDREELCELSLQLYGKKYAWQKMLKQGEWKEEVVMNRNGQPMKVKRQVHLTLEQVVDRMIDQEHKNQEAAAKVEAEKASKAQGVENGQETSQNQEQV